MSTNNTEDEKLVTFEEVRRFIIDCFLTQKVPEKNAIVVAEAMMAADMNGHYAHGVMRLPLFLESLTKKTINGFAFPEIIKETISTALVDGRNGLGAVVSRFCMDLAIKKAKQSGIAWVSAIRCNSSGMMGLFSLRAVKAGFIGISMSNSTPQVAPCRSKTRKLGSNPIAVAIPARDDLFMMDMATSVIPRARLDLYDASGQALPIGWAIDETGMFSSDPARIVKMGALSTLGGYEESGGYKGFALSSTVDILTGVLSGSGYLSNVRNIRTSNLIADVAQTFIAINPDCFSPCFQERVRDYNNYLRSSEPVNPKFPVMVPGDRRSAHIKMVERENGIPYTQKQLDILEGIAKNLRVKPMLAKLRNGKV